MEAPLLVPVAVVAIILWGCAGLAFLRLVRGTRADARRTSHDKPRRGHDTEDKRHLAWCHDTGASNGEGGYGDAGLADGGYGGGDFGGGFGDGGGGDGGGGE